MAETLSTVPTVYTFGESKRSSVSSVLDEGWTNVIITIISYRNCKRDYPVVAEVDNHDIYLPFVGWKKNLYFFLTICKIIVRYKKQTKSVARRFYRLLQKNKKIYTKTPRYYNGNFYIVQNTPGIIYELLSPRYYLRIKLKLGGVTDFNNQVYYKLSWKKKLQKSNN